MLYIVSTPIGNLKDITLRALEVLQSVDYILCEDTRTSSVLLKHYDIQKPLKSFHKFNEKSEEKKIFDSLSQGSRIALISDAGTPGISDPGEALIKGCLERNLKVEAIPGVSALIMALVVSALPASPFQFFGFLPKPPGQYKKALVHMVNYEGTSILYESPHRCVKFLQIMSEIAPDCDISLCRELTKKFEETVRGKAHELLGHFESRPPKGEIVIVCKNTPKREAAIPLEEEVEKIKHEYNISTNEALKIIADSRGIKKRDLYKQMLEKN